MVTESRMSAFRGIRKYLLLLHLTGKTQFKDAVSQDRKRDSQSHKRWTVPRAHKRDKAFIDNGRMDGRWTVISVSVSLSCPPQL